MINYNIIIQFMACQLFVPTRGLFSGWKVAGVTIFGL